MAKKRISKRICLLLNLMLPGGGLIAAGRRTSGIIQLVLALASFVMALGAIVWPMLQNYIIMLNDSKEELTSPSLTAFAGWAIIVIIIWIWSTAEIIICYNPKKCPVLPVP
jgi:hypothetical protein